MSKATLGYWDLRGISEPIRLLLHYAGADFEDVRYKDRDSWLKVKQQLGLDFPNLPYYIDGDTKITQSMAILRYLGMKHGLEGKNGEQKLRIAVVEQQLADFRMSFFRFCMNPNFENEKDNLVASLVDQLNLFTTFLGERKFLAGNDITYVDFLAYETFDFYRYVEPCCLHGLPNLVLYYKRMGSLPQLQSYLTSSAYKRWPIVHPLAPFGGSGPEPQRD